MEQLAVYRLDPDDFEESLAKLVLKKVAIEGGRLVLHIGLILEELDLKTHLILKIKTELFMPLQEIVHGKDKLELLMLEEIKYK